VVSGAPVGVTGNPSPHPPSNVSKMTAVETIGMLGMSLDFT
jgi:hypothetical protein